MGMVPLRDSLREILYSLDAPRIAEAVIKTCDESVRNLSTNLLGRLSGEYKFAFISNQLQKERLGIRKPHLTSYKLLISMRNGFLNRKIRGSSWEFRDTNPSWNNRFSNRNRQENWRETRGNNSTPRMEFNRFKGQGVADNQIFDDRRRGGQLDHGFHNQGGRQGGSRNSTFRGQNDPNRYLNC
ncbi:uncharacterized protein TNCV_4320401 [Trichonephila clavipes]|nr:uncharacterized protein TNCV_4320401 [Trichonephila clavipes]